MQPRQPWRPWRDAARWEDAFAQGGRQPAAPRQQWVWGGAPAAGDSVEIQRCGDEVRLRAQVGGRVEVRVGERSVTVGQRHLRLPVAVDPARARIQRGDGVVEVSAPVR